MFLNIIELADSFGVEEEVVEGWVRKEGLPHVVDRGRLLFDRAEVAVWAASRSGSERSSRGANSAAHGQHNGYNQNGQRKVLPSAELSARFLRTRFRHDPRGVLVLSLGTLSSLSS